MSNSMILYAFMISAGGVFSIIFPLLMLAVTKERKPVHYFQASFFLMYGYCVLCDVYARPGTASLAPCLLYANYPADFLISLAFYLYFSSIFLDKIRLRPWHLVAILPSVAVAIAYLPFYILPAEQKVALYPLSLVGPPGYLRSMSRVTEFAMFPWCLIWNVIVLRSVGKYWTVKSRPMRMAILYIASWCLVLTALSVALSLHDYRLYVISEICSEALVLMLAFITVRYPWFFLQIQKDAGARKYARSQLAALDVDAVMGKLRDLMEIEQRYRDSGLSLLSLSEELGIGAKQLSEIINSKHGQNFSAFVAAYRVQAAKAALADRPGDTILEVALSSGFNSKSTFNSAFLKAAGMTPSEFRRASRRP